MSQMHTPVDVVAARNYEAGLKATWLTLEEYKAMKPLPTKRCRECGAFQAPDSLCLDCNDTRLRLKERFNKFPIPDDAVGTIEQITPAPAEPQQPRITVSAPPYRFPYKDPED